MLKQRKRASIGGVRRKSEVDVESHECDSRHSPQRHLDGTAESRGSRRGSVREARREEEEPDGGSRQGRSSRQGSKTNAETQTSIHGINLTNALGLEVRENAAVGTDSQVRAWVWRCLCFPA